MQHISLAVSSAQDQSKNKTSPSPPRLSPARKCTWRKATAVRYAPKDGRQDAQERCNEQQHKTRHQSCQRASSHKQPRHSPSSNTINPEPKPEFGTIQHAVLANLRIATTLTYKLSQEAKIVANAHSNYTTAPNHASNKDSNKSTNKYSAWLATIPKPNPAPEPWQHHLQLPHSYLFRIPCQHIQTNPCCLMKSIQSRI